MGCPHPNRNLNLIRCERRVGWQTCNPNIALNSITDNHGRASIWRGKINVVKCDVRADCIGGAHEFGDLALVGAGGGTSEVGKVNVGHVNTRRIG
jgi:hypothetical protein